MMKVKRVSILMALVVFMALLMTGCNVSDNENNVTDPFLNYKILTVKLTSIPNNIQGEDVSIYVTNDEGLVTDDIQTQKLGSDTTIIEVRVPQGGPFLIWAIVDTSETFDYSTSDNFPKGSFFAMESDFYMTGPVSHILSKWNVVIDDEGNHEEIPTDIISTDAPDGLTADIDISDTSLTLSWNEWDDAILYYLYYAEDSVVSESDTRIMVTGYSKRLTTGNIDYGKTYTFAVMGNNSEGYDSDLSKPLTITFKFTDTTQNDTIPTDTLNVGDGNGSASDPKIIAFPSENNNAGTIDSKASYFFKGYIPQNRLVIVSSTFSMGAGPTMYVRSPQGKLLRNNKNGLANAREQLIEISEAGYYTIELVGGSTFAQNVALSIIDYDTLIGNNAAHLATVLHEPSGTVIDTVRKSVDISSTNDNYNYPQSAYFKMSVNTGDSLRFTGISSAYNTFKVYFYDAQNDSTYLPSGYWSEVIFDSLGEKYLMTFTGDLLIRITGETQYDGSEEPIPFTFYYSLNGKINFGTDSSVDTFTVTFYSNDGSSIASQQIAHGATVVKPQNPVKPNNTFVGWYRDADLTVEWDFSTPMTENIQLYAKWESNGTVVNSLGELSYEIDETDTTITLSWPALPGGTSMYVVQWAIGNTIPDLPPEDQLSTTVLDDSLYCRFYAGNHGSWVRVLSLDSTYSFVVRAYSNGDWIPTDTITVEFSVSSVVEQDSFTVQFNSNDGTVISPQKIQNGGKAVIPQIPSKTDNIFGGWYTSSAFSEAWLFDSFVVISDTTLYARWHLSGGEGTFTDVDGNVYTTVVIGNQEWIVENLRTTRFSNGKPILHATDNITWTSSSVPAFRYYNNTANNDSIVKFGAYYNWYVVDEANPEKLAGDNWRVPTNADWTVLENYMISNGSNWDESTSGNKIAKALAAKAGWDTSSTDGHIGNSPETNNSSGFSALPGGYVECNLGSFSGIGNTGYWWSATAINSSFAYGRVLYYDRDNLGTIENAVKNGVSVRLVRDVE